jgi:hypothetical protein
MGSLKLFIPFLAEVLGVNRHSLYERQRVLMRENIITTIPGRGPGSGVRVSPTSVGVLLISFLATDGLTDAGPVTRGLAQAKYIENRYESEPESLLRGARTFRAAITNVLTFEDVAAAVERVKVERRYRQATIFLREPQSEEPLNWADFGESQFDLPRDRFHTVAWLPGDCMREINRMIRDEAEQER